MVCAKVSLPGQTHVARNYKTYTGTLTCSYLQYGIRISNITKRKNITKEDTILEWYSFTTQTKDRCGQGFNFCGL